MKLFQLGLLTSIFAIFLPGCSSTPLLSQGGGKDATKICVGSPKSCTPTVGNRIRFKEQYIPISAYSRTGNVEEDAIPNLASYLGTVVQNRNHRGEPGAICGNTKKNPFTTADFTDAIVETVAETTDQVTNTTSSESNLELQRVLTAFGVNPELIDKAGASADYKRITDSLDASDASAKLIHREYRIKEAVLRELETATVGDRLFKCKDELLKEDIVSIKLYLWLMCVLILFYFKKIEIRLPPSPPK